MCKSNFTAMMNCQIFILPILYRAPYMKKTKSDLNKIARMESSEGTSAAEKKYIKTIKFEENIEANDRENLYKTIFFGCVNI